MDRNKLSTQSALALIDPKIVLQPLKAPVDHENTQFYVLRYLLSKDYIITHFSNIKKHFKQKTFYSEHCSYITSASFEKVYRIRSRLAFKYLLCAKKFV